jgi:hypothetical protein
MYEKVAKISLLGTFLRVFADKNLNKIAKTAFNSIVSNFFGKQYKAARHPGLTPVSQVDHALDGKIPFTPSKVSVYLDFTFFWIRTAGFFLKRRLKAEAASMIEAMGRLYEFAAEVYTKNLSTTRRPRYLRSFHFMLIHAFDPHLMCIPSLHVMVVICTYTKFRAAAGGLFAEQSAELKMEAQEITEAVLYIKQHSVNCISAALYAMTRFNPDLFPPEEAEDFVSGLFADASLLEEPADAACLRGYMLRLYRKFLAEGAAAASWEEPLLEFLRQSPLNEKRMPPVIRRV